MSDNKDILDKDILLMCEESPTNYAKYTLLMLKIAETAGKLQAIAEEAPHDIIPIHIQDATVAGLEKFYEKLELCLDELDELALEEEA